MSNLSGHEVGFCFVFLLIAVSVKSYGSVRVVSCLALINCGLEIVLST